MSLRKCAAAFIVAACTPAALNAQSARLLRQPTVSATEIAFTYGGDLWIVGRAGAEARR